MWPSPSKTDLFLRTDLSSSNRLNHAACYLACGQMPTVKEKCAAVLATLFEPAPGERVMRSQLAAQCTSGNKWVPNHPELLGYKWATIVAAAKELFGKGAWKLKARAFLNVKLKGTDAGAGAWRASFGKSRPTGLTMYQRAGGARDRWAILDAGEKTKFQNLAKEQTQVQVTILKPNLKANLLDIPCPADRNS